MTSTKPHIPDYMQGKLSVPKFSNLPQNLEYLLNTYQFSCKYLLKTYLLKRKKTYFHSYFGEQNQPCTFTVGAEGMLLI